MRSITLMMVTLTIFLFLCNVCIANDNKNTNVNDKEWSKAFKFGENDGGFMESIQQTSDGGYILAGHIDPKNLDNDGDTLYPWLIKTDASGNKQWEKKYNIVGNKQGDIIDLTGSFSSVLQTSDGGYILAGGDGSRTTPNGFILKIDETGKEQWNKIFSDCPVENIYSVMQSSNGGYILTGVGSFDTHYGTQCYAGKALIIKIDENGEEQWCKSFDKMSYVYSSQRTSDGGYILLGETQGQKLSEYSRTNDSDAIFIKIDENGNQEWTKIFSGKYNDGPSEIQQTSEGGYIFTGYTLSYSSERIEQEDKQKMSIWLVKYPLRNNLIQF